LKLLNITLTKQDDEFIVNLRNGSEATAYYTDDIQDALGTGRCMARLNRSFVFVKA
jgi:hypothetical protein